MTIQFRRKLLVFFIFLFGVLGTGVVLYSQGYRFDFEKWAPTKVGAIYIESYQRPIEIILNETRYKDKSGILKKGTLLSGIIPKKYKLTIQKDGFFEYQKNIAVHPSQVERFFNVLLVPQNITYATTTLATETSDQIVYLSTNGLISKVLSGKTTRWYLQLLPPITQENATGTSNDIQKTTAAFSKQKLNDFSFYSENPNELLAVGTDGVYKVLLDKKNTALVAPKNPTIPYTISDESLITIAPAPTTSTATTTQKTAKKPDPQTTPAMIVSYAINSQASSTIAFPTPRMLSDISFITIKNDIVAYGTKDKALWIYNTRKQEEKMIASDATSALFSPDAKKLLYRESSGKTHIYFIEDELETANARAGDDIPLELINAPSIRDIFWYQDSAHLILLYPTRVTLAEITNIEPNNQFTLYDGPYIKAAYNPQNNILAIARSNTEILRVDIHTFTK